MLPGMRITIQDHHDENSGRAMTAPQHAMPQNAPPPQASGGRTPQPAQLSRAVGIGSLDLIVLVGAVLVAMAAGLVLNTQLAASWEIATAAGLVIFAVAATLHVVLQRTEEISRLKSQVGAMERELTGLRPVAQRPRAPDDHRRATPQAGGPPSPSRQQDNRPLKPRHQVDERAEHGWVQPNETGPALDAGGHGRVARPILELDGCAHRQAGHGLAREHHDGLVDEVRVRADDFP